MPVNGPPITHQERAATIAMTLMRFSKGST